ncbi:HAD-IIIC family phosphatase [Kineococcus rubinsiae]|uniref:HAD-IIIC family phosphatase n=1 Tax=Kineococcus rubinsiae TaxID=2609562 RepID=UPI00142FC56D|nr:HAD-IIIC family phosphatase [Kineococcus rubinsiae]NIZ92255.1 HAD-IIIC family phosphatase [Kineococcus rubinsiae]
MSAEQARGATWDTAAPPELLRRAGELAEQDPAAAVRLLGALTGATTELPPWLAGARLVAGLPAGSWARRTVRLAVLGSHTTGHLVPLLRLAAAAHGIALDLYEAPYGQYQLEVLDPQSPLHAFRPEVVLLAVDQREARFPAHSATPAQDLEAEAARWRSLWSALRDDLGALVLQTTFVPPVDDEFGSFAVALPGARRRQLRALNLALGDDLPPGVHLVDAEAVAATAGARTYADERYWFLSKHAVGLGALPLLARAVTQVLAAAVGLQRKVVVCDLDGTLWGGVVGEDGVGGVLVGDGPAGEAFQAFQEHLRRLQQRGVLLAVVSKNNDADARAPFEQRPEMRLGLEHFAAFLATWEPKADQIARLAGELGLGLDSFVFVDDNPVEREQVRRALPEVGVVALPADPAGFVRALAEFPGMETASLTEEDARRTSSYRARAEVARARDGAGSREEFLAGLEMVLTVEPVGEDNLRRVVQLIGKTNQFNLTTRRHTEAAVRELAARPGAVAQALRLRDAHADHGLIGVLLAVPEESDLVVDTWLMSCRVLGRGLEGPALAGLLEAARRDGRRRLVGVHVPSGRNEPAARAFADAGFVPDGAADADGSTRWVHQVSGDPLPGPPVLIDLTPVVDLTAGAPRPRSLEDPCPTTSTTA